MGFKLYLGLCLLTVAISTYLIIYQNNFEILESMKPFETDQVNTAGPELAVQESQPIDRKNNDTKKQVIENMKAKTENDKRTLQKKTKTFDKPQEREIVDKPNNQAKPVEMPQTSSNANTKSSDSGTKANTKATDSSTATTTDSSTATSAIKSSPETSITTTDSKTKIVTTTDSSTDRRTETVTNTKSSSDSSTSTTATVLPTKDSVPTTPPLQSAVKKTENIMKIKKKKLPPWKTEK